MILCQYCNNPAELVRGVVIYPHRQDLFHKQFWRCEPCNARVGCHGSGSSALGDLANRELRWWRSRAHQAFDPIWREDPKTTRSEAYMWLSEQLGIKQKFTHISMFDVKQCKETIKLING